MKDLSDCRVLIVDDVKANVDVLVQALREDHKLSVALDGQAALRSVEKNPPDLVLLDIVMPGLDGYEVCRRLRAMPTTQDIPVMFLSSLEEVKNKTLGFEVGGNDYLTKPFEILEVKARVRSLLKAKAYSDAEKEKIAAELAIARDIQLGILPSNIAASVADTNLEVCAILEPAREVGGDLYEVLRLDDGRVLVAVGDVSGKGVPAALFMAVTTTLLRTMVRHHREPGEILRAVNDALAVQNPRNMFVTLLCLIVEPVTGTLTCANAGHPPPVLVRPGAAPCVTLTTTGMVSGLVSGVEIGTTRMKLRPGDTLVLYTDGVTEAFNAESSMFEEARLLECLGKVAGQSADRTASAVLDAVRRHAADCPQSDDLTVVAIRRAE
ncbi:MAG TPA: SpoIIE family protein phosphatase [Phycisphaerae bacterium]|nr:SpoIIE family protein phosphatase [Phycisphaerae bacterium]HRY70944.1 SpoIIE family protein phosphatase [Phycisphaerae bacterium]HSA29195.1 SpoIIE family protein phosphatase [Phycisphaerae bacterium]